MTSPCDGCELNHKCNYVSMSNCKEFEEFMKNRGDKDAR
jgi:hypothetical protein